MTYPTRLGQLTIEEDANILKTLLDVGGAAFVMTDPFYTYTLLPYATSAHDIGSSTLYYEDLYIEDVNLGVSNVHLATLNVVGDTDNPQLIVTVHTPVAGAGNYSHITLVSEGPVGSANEDALIYIDSGDDNAIAPAITLIAGSDSMTYTEGEGLDVEQCYRLKEVSSDPTAPGEGRMVLWQSDGAGAGDDGDIMVSIQAGATTKTITLIDFSAF